MTRFPEGHPCGGPFVLLLLLGLLAACGGPPSPGSAVPRGAAALPRPTEIYTQLGFFAGPPAFPAIGGFATLAGPADSTYVLFSMSLPASALRFQREPNGFVAEYLVDIEFVRDSVPVARLQRRESVRVPTFAETSRTDESVVFQAALALVPGSYEVRLSAGDAHSSRGFRATDTIVVPAYGSAGARLGFPVVVYDARARADRASLPEVIVNPRRTVPYGGEQARIYIEVYDTVAMPVYIRVMDDDGAIVWETASVIVADDGALAHALVDVPADVLPLGRLWLEVASPDDRSWRSPLVLTISDQWLVANFAEVLQFLRFIATSQELDSLRAGSPAERRVRWDAFWARRDPMPANPINEFREEFFQRIRFAAENFSEMGRPGWQTDRGEVYIVLGPPDYTIDRHIGRRNEMGIQPNALEWVYESTVSGRLQLVFLDRSGFGRFELTASSLNAFRNVAERLRPRPVRGG